MGKLLRRRFLFATGALLAAPVIRRAHAQGRMPRIGFLAVFSRESPRVEPFVRGMRELGYVEGKTIAIEWRSADGKDERLAGFAADLVRLNMDLIVAAETHAIEAAQRATSTIPIVFAATLDPVGSGFVKSLSRPGGNITGLSTSADELGPKQVELLISAVPNFSRIAVLVNPTNRSSASLRRIIEATARKVRLQVLSLEGGTQEEIKRAFAAARDAHADGVIVVPDGFFLDVRRLIAETALQYQLPTMSAQSLLAEAGGMMTYGPDYADNYRRAATYVDKVIKGARPANLPVEQPTTFELVINLKTAKALGLTIPQSLLLRADRVIE